MRLHFLGFLLVAAFAACAPVNSSPPIGQVSGTKGDVFRQASSGQERLAVGAPVYAADTIVTAAGGRAKIALNDGDILHMGENGKLTILAYHQAGGDGVGTRIRVENGDYRIVAPASANASIQVETEKAVATASDADFLVDVPADRTAVAALSGSVTVRPTATDAGSQVVLQRPADGTDVMRGQTPTQPKLWGDPRLKAVRGRASFD